MENKQKKQVPLRLSVTLYSDLAAWAEDEFRSVNGQIEFLLTECVRQRKKGAKRAPDIAEVRSRDGDDASSDTSETR